MLISVQNGAGDYTHFGKITETWDAILKNDSMNRIRHSTGCGNCFPSASINFILNVLDA